MTVPPTVYVDDRPLALMSCRVPELVPDGIRTIQLSLDGVVESEKDAFIVDEELGTLAAEALAARGTDIVVDFEHQSEGGEYASPSGLAPAAGWISKIWREPGWGLLAFLRWTEKAAGLIRAGEYRYFSPTLIVRKSDRKVVGVKTAALTNQPAIAGIEQVTASSRKARDLVEKYVAANVINPNHRDQYETALSLAREAPERFEKLMGRM